MQNFIRQLLANWLEVRRNRHINIVRKAYQSFDLKTLNSYPAQFVIDVLDAKP